MTRMKSVDLMRAKNAACMAEIFMLRGITAGENGRFSDQRQHIADAADHLAKALHILNTATQEKAA